MILHRRQSSPRPRGFTLVELLVVIVLIAMVSAVIVPEMKGMLEGELLHATSRKLTRALGVAYRQSVTSQLPHRLRIDVAQGRFLIERRATLEESETGFVPLENVSDAQGRFDQRIRVVIADAEAVADESKAEGAEPPSPDEQSEGRAPQTDAILFKPDGTTEKREIRLRDRQGFGVALRLNPITSRVKLVTLDHE